jgi:Xaa-Pro aminopeptidase
MLWTRWQPNRRNEPDGNPVSAAARDHRPARLAKARAFCARRRLDWLLVSDPYDVLYLSGFRGGDDACLLVGPHDALICTDSRYWAQVAEEVDGFELVRAESLLADALAAVARRGAASASIGFEGAHITYVQHRKLRRLHDGPLRDIGAALLELRAVKDAGEIECIRHAAAITDTALEVVVATGLEGRSERAVAWQIADELERRGAEGLAFASIVAAGERAALAHAIPSERPIKPGELVVIDTGARVGGYCSDITRTFAVGAASDEQRRIYDIVLQAQLAGLSAVCAGAHGRDDVDAAARSVIAAAGFAEEFGHGTGHGVGLEVHERPRLGRREGDRLAAGMVATVEPGIYLEGSLGVRIEDSVVVTESGCECLTLFAKDLRVVG